MNFVHIGNRYINLTQIAYVERGSDGAGNYVTVWFTGERERLSFILHGAEAEQLVAALRVGEGRRPQTADSGARRTEFRGDREKRSGVKTNRIPG